MEEKEKQVFDALSAQCARREYCTADIRRKALQRLDFDAAGAETVVAALQEEGFVDDRRYAAAFAGAPSRSAPPCSPARFRARSSPKRWRKSIRTAPRPGWRKCWKPSGKPSPTTRRAASSSSVSPSPAATTTSPSARLSNASRLRDDTAGQAARVFLRQDARRGKRLHRPVLPRGVFAEQDDGARGLPGPDVGVLPQGIGRQRP